MDEDQVTEDLNEEVQTGDDEPEDGGLVGATLFDSLYAAADGEYEEVQTPGGQAITDSLSGEPTLHDTQHDTQQEEGTAKKKVKRLHKREVIDPDLPSAPASDFTFPDGIEDDSEDLLPEEREQLRVMEHISRKNNTQQDKELKEYFKKQKEYIERRLESDPDLDLSNDHEFEQFVARNRPQLDMTEIRSAEREMLLNEAEERAIKRLRPEVEKTNIKTRRLQIKPQVDVAKQQAEHKAMGMVPEFLADQLKDRSPEDVQRDNPYEFNIVNSALTNAARFASTFLDISKGMVDYSPSNQDHEQLRTWLIQEQDAFIRGGQTKDSNGRPFMRRERYMRLPPTEQQKYWTWSDEQCVDIMYARAKDAMDGELKQHESAMQAYLSKSGQPAPAPAPTPTPRAPKPTPRAGGTPSTRSSDQAISPLSLLGM